MTGMQALRVEKITSLEEFSALQAECNILEKFSIDNIFLTPAWLSLWWVVYKGDCHLNVLAVREGEFLIGLLPLVLQRNFGLLRRLVFMGSGELTPNDVDVLSIPGRQNDVLQAVATYLFENRSDWDILELDKLPCVGNTSEFLTSFFKSRGWTTELTCTAHCFRLTCLLRTTPTSPLSPNPSGTISTAWNGTWNMISLKWSSSAPERRTRRSRRCMHWSAFTRRAGPKGDTLAHLPASGSAPSITRSSSGC